MPVRAGIEIFKKSICSKISKPLCTCSFKYTKHKYLVKNKICLPSLWKNPVKVNCRCEDKLKKQEKNSRVKLGHIKYSDCFYEWWENVSVKFRWYFGS